MTEQDEILLARKVKAILVFIIGFFGTLILLIIGKPIPFFSLPVAGLFGAYSFWSILQIERGKHDH